MTEAVDHSRLIEKAISIVGWNSPPDNKSLFEDQFDAAHVAPLRCFEPDSAVLVAALDSKPVRAVVASYCLHNKKADEFQVKYKSISRLIPLPMLAAIALSIVLIYCTPSAIADWLASFFAPNPETLRTFEINVRLFTPVLIISGLIMTPVLAVLSHPGEAYRQWKEHRATAEALRTELFKHVFKAKWTGASGQDPALALLLKLEYFRRWQVEVQSAYFRKRKRDHAQAVSTTNRMIWAYFAASAVWCAVLIAAAIGSIDEQRPVAFFGWSGSNTLLAGLSTLEQWSLDRLLLLAGLVLALAAAYLTHRRMLSESIRNAARFDVMEKRFKDIEEKLGDIRQAAARNDMATVLEFVDRVHSTMSLELADWVRLADLDLGNESPASFDAAHRAKTEPQVSTS